MLPSNVEQFPTTNPPPSRSGGPRFSGGLLGTLVLLVVLGAVIYLAVTRMPVGTPARPTPAPTAAGAPAAAAGVPADQATAAAIQEAIRKLDNAQAQAMKSGNQQVMQDTATPEFYAEEVATNQDLADSGVTEVELLNIEWGDITLNGNTATATNWETWSTTFEDGTTLQSRDRNVYTLIKDASGTWKIASDEHPDAPQGP